MTEKADEVIENLSRSSAWLRLLFMLVFAVALYVLGVIFSVLILAQVLFSLFAGRDNENLRNFGAALTEYLREIMQFLTYNTEEKPFPFAPFPLMQPPVVMTKPKRATRSPKTGTKRRASGTSTSSAKKAASADNEMKNKDNDAEFGA